MEETTQETAEASEELAVALANALRGACGGERMNEELEGNVVNGLCTMARDAISAYLSCRAHAREGLAMAYEQVARIDSLGISCETRHR